MPANPTVHFEILSPDKQNKQLLRDLYVNTDKDISKPAVATITLAIGNIAVLNEKKNEEEDMDANMIKLLERIKKEILDSEIEKQSDLNEQNGGNHYNMVGPMYHPANPYFAPINVSPSVQFWHLFFFIEFFPFIYVTADPLSQAADECKSYGGQHTGGSYNALAPNKSTFHPYNSSPLRLFNTSAMNSQQMQTQQMRKYRNTWHLNHSRLKKAKNISKVYNTDSENSNIELVKADSACSESNNKNDEEVAPSTSLLTTVLNSSLQDDKNREFKPVKKEAKPLCRYGTMCTRKDCYYRHLMGRMGILFLCAYVFVHFQFFSMTAISLKKC
ncbi:hypothetical protein RFI_12169 [Reticulomyxa filosa]|uniref:C3H1-type domain-containing protein n=1 Tax=Reticulomyxa filosa TaxID=46433 RepID=X6NGY4_RETFI|nr:hypothetical protein RFI_12169 [Reticulomyxa filosa]|eukprot:ETO24974.1 hypothetical protein RFI_12169 [Reticulomyxa filosa]